MNFPIPNNAILIRVAVDQTSGEWNGPCNPNTGDFVYVPIPQNKPNISGMEKYYASLLVPALHKFSLMNNTEVVLPERLHTLRMHLDPDYYHLSYGDTAKRGGKLLTFKENDWVVFYSALRPIQGGSRLIYALTGMLVVDSVRQVGNVPPSEDDQNAHTRLLNKNDSDIIVRGKPDFSGRFAKYIDIGDFRNNSYRVRNGILESWGGLSVNDGWIQRSANPPLFLDPEKFAKWLISKNPILHQFNN